MSFHYDLVVEGKLRTTGCRSLPPGEPVEENNRR
jgi:hypothetical protein